MSKNVDIEQLNKRAHSCHERMINLLNNGFKPKVIFDVGAYLGVWSQKTAEFYSESFFVLVEPNTALTDKISENLKAISSRAKLVQVAVGSESSTAKLNIWNNSKHKDPTVAFAASSLLDHVQGDASTQIEVPVKPLDLIAKELNLYPDLLKLDLQGYELSALKGAEECLKRAECCIIEFGCLDAYVNRTSPNDVMSFMYEREYVLYDIVDLIYRPYDGALVGGDFFFVKKSSALKSHRDYF